MLTLCDIRWREAPKPGPSDYISVAVTFSTGPGGELLCAFIEGLEEAIEATFTPELLGEEQYLDEEISTLLSRSPRVESFSTTVMYADDEALQIYPARRRCLILVVDSNVSPRVLLGR